MVSWVWVTWRLQTVNLIVSSGKAIHLLSSSSVFPVPHMLVLSPSSAEHLQGNLLLQYLQNMGRWKGVPSHSPHPQPEHLVFGRGKPDYRLRASHYAGFCLCEDVNRREASAGNYRNHELCSV